MFKYSLFLGALSILAVLLLVLSGCQSGGGKISASLDEEFSLAIGQTAEIGEEQLILKFEEVLGDSRCPTGATCIWTGEVSCMLRITDNEHSSRIVLTEPGLSDQGGKTIYDDRYEITFHVMPYPELGKEISMYEYRLRLTLSRLPQLTEKVGPIIDTPYSFEGHSITVVGYYRGWDLLQEANTSPPVTRSDWVIKDSTGAIYVSANSEAKIPEGLNPASLEDTGVILEVEGVMRITKGGQPYIEATSVKQVS